MHASSTAKTPIGSYANEYMLALTFTDDGTKVIRFDEFVDSAFSASYFARLQEWAASSMAGSG